MEERRFEATAVTNDVIDLFNPHSQIFLGEEPHSAAGCRHADGQISERYCFVAN